MIQDRARSTCRLRAARLGFLLSVFLATACASADNPGAAHGGVGAEAAAPGDDAAGATSDSGSPGSDAAAEAEALDAARDSEAPDVGGDAVAPSPSGYSYHGVPIYSANDWFTTDLTKPSTNYVSTTVDPNSSNIVAYLESVYGDIVWYTGSGNQETVNLATKGTTMRVVTGCNYGCNDDPWNDDPNPFEIPVSSPFFQEGKSDGSGCGGDCHVIVLNVDDHLTYETYTSGRVSWNGTTYAAESAVVHNLDHPYNDQMHLTGGTAGNTPLLGTTDWGEEASLAAIPHILGFQMPVNQQAMSGHVDPANGNTSCSTDCTQTLPYGARLRLKASFACPPAAKYPQANLVCVQLKTYGMILDDVNADSCKTHGVGAGYCVYGLRFGNATDGTTLWSGDGCCGNAPSGQLDQLLMPAGGYYMHISDFEVMTLGTIHH